jgi:hypothetical protein
MTSNGRPLWHWRARGPWLRLGFGLVAAPVTLAALLTLLSFVIYAVSEPELGVAFDYAGRAAAAYLVHLLTFTVSLGLAGVAGLWALGKRRALVWAATGAGAGALYALAVGAGSGAGASPIHVILAALLGTAMFVLARWFAGITAG